MNEPGLQYLTELGLKPAKTTKESENILYAAAETKLVDNLIGYLIDRSNDKFDNKKFYNAKCETLDLSLALDGAYYGNVYRYVFNWIAKSEDIFKGEILDVGCNSGIISCFIAKTFPDAHITGIDICEKAIETAKELAKRLNVTNVTFKVENLKAVKKESFDVVFSMRTLQEISDAKKVNDLPYNLKDGAKMIALSYKYFANILADKVKPEGKLISIESLLFTSRLLGWMYAINDAKLNIQKELFETLECFYVDEETQYQVITAIKSKDQYTEPTEVFEYAYRQLYDVSQPLYFADDAKILGFIKADEMIEGYTVYDSRHKFAGQWSLWTHKEDVTGLILYRNIDGSCVTEFHDIGDKYHISCTLKREIKNFNAQGYTFKKIQL